MSEYMPKVGDKVRAVLGENLLVGEITYKNTTDAWWQIVADGVEDVDPFVLSNADGWQFEQVVSVPSKFGAVIRRADGESFWLTTRSEKACPWLTQHGFWTDEKNATRGGFTVLFDGVDE